MRRNSNLIKFKKKYESTHRMRVQNVMEKIVKISEKSRFRWLKKFCSQNNSSF